MPYAYRDLGQGPIHNLSATRKTAVPTPTSISILPSGTIYSLNQKVLIRHRGSADTPAAEAVGFGILTCETVTAAL